MKLGTESNALRFTLLIRNNLTKKHKCIRFDDPKIKNEKELLELIKKLLAKHYKK